jgi:hypothetical protein
MTQWRKPLAAIASTLAAAAFPTFIVVAMVFAVAAYDVPGRDWWVMCGTIFGLALAHAVLLGLPAALWLRRVNRFRWLPVAAVGLLVGALPYASFSLVNGDPIGEVLEDASVLGLLGVCGALAFFATWRATKVE